MGAMLVRHEPTSASDVRLELVADLEALGVDVDAIDGAALVVSELVGNAIRHTEQRDEHLDVQWAIDAGELVVSVADPSPELPRVRDVGPEATSGRGLTIVESVSTAWGVDPLPGGKRVWARVPLDAQP